MNKFDKEEQIIHEAISQIEMDAEGFKTKLNRRMMNMNETKTKRTFKLKTPAGIAAALAGFMLLSTAAYAMVTGGLDFFREELEAPFANLAGEPLVPAYTENEGIHIEVVGARQSENSVLLYLTLQDTTGENRLNDRSSLNLDLYVGDTRITGNPGAPFPGSAATTSFLHFNRETNTTYLQMVVQGNENLRALDQFDSFILKGSQITISNPDGEAFFSRDGEGAISGEWNIDVEMDLTYQLDGMTWSNVSVGELNINHMMLTTFGIDGYGTHTVGGDGPDIEIYVELNDSDVIPLRAGSHGGNRTTFSFNYTPDQPINLDDVTAIIINGERIEVE